MDPFKRAIYLLALNELGQITTAELRAELPQLQEQMKAYLESGSTRDAFAEQHPGY